MEKIISTEAKLKMAKAAVEFITQLKSKGIVPTAEQYEVAYDEMLPVVEAACPEIDSHYDYASAIEYLEKTCPADVMAAYLKDSICDLATLLSYVDDLHIKIDGERIVRLFVGINATLSVCRKFFEAVQTPDEQELEED